MARFALTAESAEARMHELACVDFLRVIAAFAVFLEHLTWITASNHSALRSFSFFLGGWGVNCFFVLSGFLLGRPYVEALLENKTLPSTKEYLFRRFFRIWPLYAICIIFIFIKLALAHPIFFKTYAAELFAYLTMTQNFCAICASETYTTQMWTMAIDAQFYVLLPILAYAAAYMLRGSNQRYRKRLIICSVLAVIPISLLTRYWGSEANIVGMSVAFALGIGLNLLRGTLPNHATASAIGIFGVLLVPIVEVTHDNPTLLPWSIYDLIGALSAACLLYAFLEGGFSGAARLAHTRTIQRLAQQTYSFYLLHIWTLHWVYFEIGKFMYKYHETIAFEVVVGSICLVVTLAIASVTYHYIELPCLKMKERHLPQKGVGFRLPP